MTAFLRERKQSLRRRLIGFVQGHQLLLLILFVGVTASAFGYPYPQIAAWLGFLFAAYSTVANDSIQTIGTFIASNRHQRWWRLWLFIGGVFLLTVGYSWMTYDGDVTFQRLAAKGFSESPSSFSFLQIAAPLVLLVLTRLRMPVSTTFLLLTSFATSAASVEAVLGKSFNGYILTFAISFTLWATLGTSFQRWFRGRPSKFWRVAQWVTTACLWSVWLQQDAANIAVYLPRSLGAWEFAAFAGVIFFGLGVLFYIGGEKVQQVVDEKADVVDVRSATIIDLVYALVLYYFKVVSNTPMSTTWVFVGLLGGRELALALRRVSGRSVGQAVHLLARDFLYVTFGLLISILIAVLVNEELRRAFLGL